MLPRGIPGSVGVMDQGEAGLHGWWWGCCRAQIFWDQSMIIVFTGSVAA